MAGESLAGRLLDGFPEDLAGDLDLADVMSGLCDRCVDVLDVSAAAVMLRSPLGELRIAGTSTTCPPGVSSPAQIHAWPSREAGFGFVHAVPMRGGGQAVGTVLLFRTEASPLDDDGLDAVGIVAEVATVVVLEHRRHRAGHRRPIGAALRARIVVEQAVGMIAERDGLAPGPALDALRRRAGDGRRLTAVAEEIVGASRGRGAR